MRVLLRRFLAFTDPHPTPQRRQVKMSKTTLELPVITQDMVVDAVRALGLVPGDTREVHIYLSHVEIVMMPRDNNDGHHFVAGDRVATATVTLPIEEGPAGQEDPPATTHWFDRARLIDVLILHRRITHFDGCTCGWDDAEQRWPEHIADVYEEGTLPEPDLI